MDHPPPDSQNPYASSAIPKESKRSALPPSANKPNEPLVEPIRTSGAMSIFCKFRYSPRLVVLYYDENPFQFGIIPRSKFQTQHDWECFIGLLDRKLPRY